MHWPEPLAEGDAICVVAPSSPFDREAFRRGVDWLQNRYRLTFDEGLFAREGYLAGDDERRLRELQRALDDPDARAVVVARGGYGASRIAHRIDYRGLLERPKWLVGFSDVTALHLELARVGVASCHADNVTTLGRASGARREAWRSALEASNEPRTWTQLETLRGGRAHGPLVGGNLSLVSTAATAGRLRLPPGSVLFLEEVNEAPYRIDRILNGLVMGGHLADVSAVCVGQLSDRDRADGSEETARAVWRALEPLGVPVVMGLPIGHGEPNEPIFLGSQATLDAGTLSCAPAPGAR